MKVITLVAVLSMFTCLHARAVKENFIAETASCEGGDATCRITEGIARLVLNPFRTIKIIREAIADFIHFIRSFSLKELLEAVIGAVAVQVSIAIHSPGLIENAIVYTYAELFPKLKMMLIDIEDHWRNWPLEQAKVLVTGMVLVPLLTVLEVIEGIVVALSQSGFPNFHKRFIFVKRIGQAIYGMIGRSIMIFQCTKIRSQNSCDNLFHVFEDIVVNPAFNFLNGLMEIVHKVLQKAVVVVLPIVHELSLSKLEAYCKRFLSKENCAKIEFCILKIDRFGTKEMRKAVDHVINVLQWIIRHIFTDDVQSKIQIVNVIKS